jgi:predicted O-methyltransferase YrrM
MRKMLTWKPTQLDDGIIDTSLTENETAALRRLANGKHVLEIGSGFGYSAIVMAQVAERVTAVDPHAGELPDSLPVMVQNLTRYRVAEKVVIVREGSQTALPAMIKGGRRFEFIFIDGNHGERVEGDVALSRKLLEPGGCFAVHDLYGDEWGTEGCDFPEIARVLRGLPFEPVRVVDTLAIYQPPS